MTRKSSLPLGLLPYEIGYLILLATAFYYSQGNFRGSPIPLPVISAAMLGGVGVLIGRCREEWQQLPNKILFFVLAAAWVALFYLTGNSTLGYVHSSSLFPWLLDIYTHPDSDLQFGLIMPFAVLGLFWWKRQELVARPAELWWPGMLIMLLALGLHLAGFGVQLPHLSTAGFLLGLYGLTGLVWGWHWLKTSFFPFFLLGFCVPLGGLMDSFTFKLRLLVSFLVEHIAHLGLAPDLIRQGTQLMDAQHTFAYEVAAACSGIRSLFSLLALMTVYAFITMKSPWRRLTMMVASVPLAILGNVCRLCFTIFVAELFGQDAGKSVETNAGYITFIVAFGCAYLLANWLVKREEAAKPAVTAPSEAPVS
jgi:exosortase